MDFKKTFFIIIFKLKNGNFKTQDFSPLIERVLAGVLHNPAPPWPKALFFPDLRQHLELPKLELPVIEEA